MRQQTVHSILLCFVNVYIFCREAGCTPFATSLIADYFPEVSVSSIHCYQQQSNSRFDSQKVVKKQ